MDDKKKIAIYKVAQEWLNFLEVRAETFDFTGELIKKKKIQ